MLTKRPGDTGSTTLLFGEEVGKDHLLLETCGVIEELIVWYESIMVQKLLDKTFNTKIINNLEKIIKETACSDRVRFRSENPHLTEQDVEELETQIVLLKKRLSDKGVNFVRQLSLLEVLSRKAERRIVALIKYEQSKFSMLSPIVPREKTLDTNYLRKNKTLRTLFAAYFNRLNEYHSLLNEYGKSLDFEISSENFESDIPTMSSLQGRRKPNVSNS